MFKKNLLASVLISSIGLCGTFAHAQPAQNDLMPPVTTQATLPPGAASLDGETHPSLKMTPDKSELVRLDRDASSVVVGNSAQITVLLDTPRLAVVIPRAAGATYFSVLDKEGNIIMQRHVIVASPKKNYVRVRRSCANAAEGSNCQATSVYFCPDMCHEVGAAAGQEQASGTPAGTAE
ncbi:MAG: hypothetical protein DI551_04120 [Micavibrio aeruginosavorus]|uniref:Pilus formation protein N-terminal domain-containing protein n=1 Tax=Micavibrio aeruginosavorus TaxID=349221 RepID=A0A2W5N860_9BACT|nr:MAG: hypothetical protein DI551_04120 [Micavibrio aeruginosavorus]